MISVFLLEQGLTASFALAYSASEFSGVHVEVYLFEKGFLVLLIVYEY